MNKDVSFERSDYKKALEDWVLVDDVCAGEKVVKAKGEKYLPRPNPDDKSQEARKRYYQYKMRAMFFGATGATLQGLTGLAFAKEPTVILPTALEYLSSNVDGKGVSLSQQARQSLGAVLKRGRHGLLVDYPEAPQGRSRADDDALSLRASIIKVDATNVINWQTTTIGGVTKLSLVVIREIVERQGEDGFSVSDVEQFRVLQLIGGIYEVDIWQKTTDRTSRNLYERISNSIPSDYAGNPWREIPFYFIGSENNDHSIDPIPLLDMANVNLAHYRNSADYEHSTFFCGQVQPTIKGLNVEWRTHLEDRGIVLGSVSPLLLPVGGDFVFAQAEPNTLVKEAMDTKEKQLIALGARMIEPSSIAKTATQSNNDKANQHSILSLAASNVAQAYKQCLEWAGRFMGSDSDVEMSISDEYMQPTLDPNLINAIVSSWQQNALPTSDMLYKLKEIGLIRADRELDDIVDEIQDSDDGLGLNDDD